MAPSWCLPVLPAQCVPPKGLAKLCPPGGTLRSPSHCCLVPRSLPSLWAQHFLQCEEQRKRENREKMNHLENEKQEG